MNKKLICDCHGYEFETSNKLYRHLYKIDYNQIHKEENHSCSKNWRLENLIKVSEYSKNYYQKHRERNIRLCSERYYNNVEEIAEYKKKYNKENQKKLAVYSQNRRKINENFSKLTVELLQEVYQDNIKKYGVLTCDLCLKPVKFGEDSLEHFIPISRYKEFPNVDLNTKNNLGIAHDGRKSKERCNLKKRAKTLEEWFQKYPEYLSRVGV